jgi:hypothetical protein
VEAATHDLRVYHFHIPAKEKQIAIRQNAVNEKAFFQDERAAAVFLAFMFLNHIVSIFKLFIVMGLSRQN